MNAIIDKTKTALVVIDLQKGYNRHASTTA